jgi:hypothetical protein
VEIDSLVPRINDEEVTVNYTLPMPPQDSDEEKLAVLPFIQSGRPRRSRTMNYQNFRETISIVF